MPASGWNRKFQGIGNGGFAGAISYGGLGAALSHGYATASTDTGHEAGGTDAGWALHHPREDRSISDTGPSTKPPKKPSLSFGRSTADDPSRSYFSSCSNGGRQALMEAQRFPEDYDGIIAGAPANYWTHLLAGAAADMQSPRWPTRQLYFLPQTAGHPGSGSGRLRRSRWRERRRHRRPCALSLRS